MFSMKKYSNHIFLVFIVLVFFSAKGFALEFKAFLNS